MAVALTQTPRYPLPSTPVRCVVSADGGGDWAKIWITAAPLGSVWRKELDDSDAGRIELFDDATGEAFEFNGDVAGVYVLTAQEYTKNAATYGGGYSGDPNGFATETAAGGATALTIDIGSRLTSQIGSSPDTATLVLHVWGATIRKTTASIHGENTPAITAPTSPRARTAAETSGVLAAATAVADTTASTAIGDLAVAISDFRSKYHAHIADAAAHPSADTDNTLGNLVLNPTSASGAVAAVNELITKFRQHAINDAGDGDGPGEAPYHNEPDWTNAPASGSVGDVAGATNAFADLYAAYEAHRIEDVTAHDAADVTNILATLAGLLDVHSAFSSVVKSVNPTNPETMNSGATLLVHSAGFKEG